MKTLKGVILLFGLMLAVSTAVISMAASPVAAIATMSSCEEDPEAEDGGAGSYCNCDDLETGNTLCHKSSGSTCIFSPPTQCSTSCTCVVVE